jgi:eukaryotic-like serine/threonine-protein kinase
MPSEAAPRSIGRYVLYGEIASGGMATVHFGRLSGPAGFSRTVAIKRLHPQYARDPEFVSMFLDEARLAARIRHPNVVTTLDVVTTGAEIFLVMEYVQGESLSRLLRAVRPMMTPADTRIVATIVSGVLHGLHAAHEARDEQGQPLRIVHRDVSPQNVMVGTDGVPRVLDFGVAKAAGRVQTTREGQLKGKIAYMAPEQLHGATVTRQTDVYAAAVVAWEALTGKRLFQFDNEAALVTAILLGTIPPPSQAARHVPIAFDHVVMRGLERDVLRRYATAREMAIDMERCVGIATPSEVGEWVESLAQEELLARAIRIADIESASSSGGGVLPSTAELATTVEGPVLRAGREASEPSAPTPVPAELRSDVSSIAVSPAFLLQPRRALSRATLAAGAAIAAGVLVLATLLISGRGARSTSDVAASAGLPAPPATPPPPAPPPPPTPTVPAEAHSNDTVSVTSLPIAPPAPPAPAPPSVVRRRVVAPAPAPTPSPAQPDCDPPFTIDEAGHKHYKPACLQ